MRLLAYVTVWNIYVILTFSMEVKVFKYGVGDRAINMVDETQFQFPDPRDFTDDIVKEVDFKDEYDELVPSLPRFDIHKWGEETVLGSVPIVTRPKPYWSTPSPRKLNEKSFSTPASVLAALEAVRATRPTHGPAKTTTPAPIITPETTNIDPIIEKLATTPIEAPTTTPAEPTTRVTTTKTPTTAKPAFNTPEITRKPLPTTVRTPSAASPPVWRNLNFINRNNEVTVGKSLRTGLFGSSSSTRTVLDGRGRPVELKFGTSKLSSSSTTSPSAPPIFNRPTPPMWQRSWSSRWKIGPNGQKIDESTTVTETRGGRTETQTVSGGIENIPRILPPPIIHTNPKEYRGPTFNCRILDASLDGVASPDNDETCKLNFPGYPADETCRCTFKVQGRDESGCANGFLYTCRRVVFT